MGGFGLSQSCQRRKPSSFRSRQRADGTAGWGDPARERQQLPTARSRAWGTAQAAQQQGRALQRPAATSLLLPGAPAWLSEAVQPPRARSSPLGARQAHPAMPPAPLCPPVGPVLPWPSRASPPLCCHGKGHGAWARCRGCVARSLGQRGSCGRRSGGCRVPSCGKRRRRAPRGWFWGRGSPSTTRGGAGCCQPLLAFC